MVSPQQKLDHAKKLIAEFTKWAENGSDKAAKVLILNGAKLFVDTCIPTLAPFIDPQIEVLIDEVENPPVAA